jgi:hypothetical protein
MRHSAEPPGMPFEPVCSKLPFLLQVTRFQKSCGKRKKIKKLKKTGWILLPVFIPPPGFLWRLEYSSMAAVWRL